MFISALINKLFNASLLFFMINLNSIQVKDTYNIQFYKKL